MRRYWTPIRVTKSDAAGGRSQSELPNAIFMTDSQRTPNPLPIIRSLPAKTGVILRHYEDPERHQLIEKIRYYCKKRALFFILALTETPIALPAADGYHLPEHLCININRVEISRLSRLGKITASAHSEASLRTIAALGIDAALLSPIFQTMSHPEQLPIGLHRFFRILERAKLPVFALGGVESKKLTCVSRQRNFAGMAGIALFRRKIRN